MTNPPGSAEDPTLLFEWAPPKGEKFLISVFLIGSLFFHAAAFYLFRIIYPPAIALLPPPARVQLISPGSEEGRTLLRWIEAEDPALASATLRPSDIKMRALPKLQHLASYMVVEPKLKDAPPMDVTPVAPSAFPPQPLAVFRKSVEPAWPKLATRVSFSEELKQLGQVKFAPTQFAGSTGEPPENARFRIGINRGGEIRYCFRLSSSGDSALDDQARLWLVRARFEVAPPTKAESEEAHLIWGVATVEWGNDVTQPARSPTPAEQ